MFVAKKNQPFNLHIIESGVELLGFPFRKKFEAVLTITCCIGLSVAFSRYVRGAIVTMLRDAHHSHIALKAGALRGVYENEENTDSVGIGRCDGRQRRLCRSLPEFVPSWLSLFGNGDRRSCDDWRAEGDCGA